MNKILGLDYEKFDLVANLLTRSKWIYAKTMYSCPHEYTLRKDWHFEHILPWESVVQFTRDHSYDEYFYSKKFQRLNINHRKYWSMGAPLLETTLINRALIEGIQQNYDSVAGIYDDTYNFESAIKENSEVAALIDYKEGLVLDIGCGTGLFKELFDFGDYVGIDPSSQMVNIFHKKIPPDPKVRVINTSFEEFYYPIKFDLIVSLFGSISYVDPKSLTRIHGMLNKGGRFFLMFYKENYEPKIHSKIQGPIHHYKFKPFFKDCEITEYNNYLIVRGKNEN